jgi:hypothetical protein
MKDQPGWSDIKEITLAKVRHARLVQHLMKDQRSLDALDIAERWAKNEATDEELKTAAAAYAAYAASATSAAAYASAASAAASAADVYATYASAAYAAYAAYADYYAAEAKKENQQLAGDICRKYLPIEIWNIS